MSEWFWAIWLTGGALASGCYSYDCKVGREKPDANVIWVILFFWWAMLGIAVGGWLGRRAVKRSQDHQQ